MDSLMTNPQSLLLDIFSTIRPVPPERFSDLNTNQWTRLARIACQHRLEPMLYHQIQVRRLQRYVPQEIISKWAKGYRQAAINSLNLQRSLFNLNYILGAANIPFLLVKGSWLAWNAYSHPALRPMRDIDILVRQEHADDTFKLLKAAGFTQFEACNIPFDILLKSNKHLPGLVCSQTLNKVEIHVRLFTVDDKKPIPAALADFDRLYERKQIVCYDNKQMAYLSTTDTLLHVIVHAVDDHVFNNGPVIIADVLHILQHGGVDWPYFWAVAVEGNWINAVQLVFDMVEYYNGEQNIDWCQFNRGETPVIIIQTAAVLSLQDIDARSNFVLAVDLARESGYMAKSMRFCRRLFPTRYTLATIWDVGAYNPLIIMSYPIWFFRNIRKFYKGVPKELSTNSLVNPVVGWLSR
jgi:hypothetical protein